MMFKKDQRIDASILSSPNKDVKPVTIGDSDDVKIGDKVILISTPKGAKNTISIGNVKGYADNQGIHGIVVSNDADYGSSGGALFNDKGELIGIIMAGDSNLKVSFIIPINDVRKALSN